MPVTPAMVGKSFFVRVDGRLHATPLFIALLFLFIRLLPMVSIFEMRAILPEAKVAEEEP